MIYNKRNTIELKFSLQRFDREEGVVLTIKKNERKKLFTIVILEII